MLGPSPNSLILSIEQRKGPVEISTKILKKLICLFKEALTDSSIIKLVKKTQELWLKEERKQFFTNQLS